MTEKEYELNDFICKLTTQWESKPDEDGDGGNSLKALVAIFNICYHDIAQIVEDGNEMYIQPKSSAVQSVEPTKPAEQQAGPEATFLLSKLPSTFKGDFSRRFITSLLAKPFVILTGNSGTGKTRIALRFAKYLEETFDDGKNWLLVPVGADWTDNTKILGFYNPLADGGKGDYEKTDILKLIEKANAHPTSPFFLILDEMNLSHVERYFADFLSHMETGEDMHLDDPKGEIVRFPSNLFVVGTVNIDETTYMFSPKVLDRANVIEFRPKKEDVINLFDGQSAKEEEKKAEEGVPEAFVKLVQEIRDGKCLLSANQIDEIKEIFGQIYDKLNKTGFEFAYRTTKEIRQYISASYELSKDKNDFNLTQAEDEQLLQKVMPKIHGNAKKLKTLLESLSEICKNNGLILSEEKIEQMQTRLLQVQYASYM